MWYNVTGAFELGEPYTSWTSLLYSIGSLVPAMFLAVHSTKLAFAKTDEARQSLTAKKSYKYICYFYLAIIGFMALFRVYMHV